MTPCFVRLVRPTTMASGGKIDPKAIRLFVALVFGIVHPSTGSRCERQGNAKSVPEADLENGRSPSPYRAGSCAADTWAETGTGLCRGRNRICKGLQIGARICRSCSELYRRDGGRDVGGTQRPAQAGTPTGATVGVPA